MPSIYCLKSQTALFCHRGASQTTYHSFRWEINCKYAYEVLIKWTSIMFRLLAAVTGALPKIWNCKEATLNWMYYKMEMWQPTFRFSTQRNFVIGELTHPCHPYHMSPVLLLKLPGLLKKLFSETISSHHTSTQDSEIILHKWLTPFCLSM